MAKSLLAALALVVLAGVAWIASCLVGPLPEDDAEARIREIRTRLLTLRLLDAGGRPVAEELVRVRMRRHQFWFGANLYGFGKQTTPGHEDRYRELFSDLFNQATLPFYLGQYQPEPGRDDSERLESMVAWAASRGIEVKGHPLVWHSPTAMPRWLPDETAEVERVHRDRVTSIVERFRGRVAAWDVVNEPTMAWLYDTPVAHWERESGPGEVTRRALAWARSADPEAVLLVNEFNVGPGPWMALALFDPLRTLRALTDPVPQHPFSFLRFLSELDAAGGEFDAVGIQSHMHTGRWPMALVWRSCERYAAMGRPLHWTEITVLSGEAKRRIRPEDPTWQPAWPSTPEGERAQADYVERFYTLLFSHPAVAALTWWDLSDRDAWMGAPAGLVRADLTLKPAYERLRRLIRERWWTDLEGRTDAEGRLALRGFCGEYELVGAGGSSRAAFAIDCAKSGARELDLLLR